MFTNFTGFHLVATLVLWFLPTSVFGIEGLTVGVISIILGYAVLYLAGSLHIF